MIPYEKWKKGLTDDSGVRVGVEIIGFRVDSTEVLPWYRRSADVDVLLRNYPRDSTRSLKAVSSVSFSEMYRETYVFDGEGIAVCSVRATLTSVELLRLAVRAVHR